MKRILKKLISFPVAGIVLLYIGVCIYFYSIQEMSLFPARTIPHDFIYTFETPHEELFLDSADGARINAVLFKTDEPRGVVLYFHGNATNMRHMEHVGKPFTRMGFDLLAIDYRGYGKSVGELSEQALFDDARLAMDYLVDIGWRESDIILYGRSIGSGVATQLASVSTPRALILYSPYYSMLDLVSEKVPYLPASLILKYPLDSATYMQSVSAPVLILHGDKDTLIPISHALDLAAVRGQLIRFPQGDHNNLTRFPEFWQAIEAFMDDYRKPE